MLVAGGGDCPHFSQKVRSPTPEALQNLGFDWVIAL